MKILRQLGDVAHDNNHPGLNFTRLADDIFEIDGPTSSHCCIAMEPQGVSLRILQDVFPDGILPKLLVKNLVHRLLFAINFLHADCNVVHTGKIAQPALRQPDQLNV